MSMSTEFISNLKEVQVAAAQAQFIRQACILAAITLLLCETCQTLDCEVSFLWARGRARMILLFATIRHVQLASLVLNSISDATSLGTSSAETCATVFLVSSIVTVIPYLGWAVFLGWRAYGLSTKNVFIGFLVFIGSIFFVSPSLLQIAGTTISYTATPPTCLIFWKWADGVAIESLLVNVSRAANLLSEVVVLVLTCRATYETWRTSREGNRPASLAVILYKDGLICFVAGTVAHTISWMFTLVPRLAANPNSVATVAVLRDTIITVFLSRFILELAGLGAQASDAKQGALATKGVLTTEWTGEISDIPSQWSLDDEYNGRGFDKDIDTLEIKDKDCYEA